MHRTGAILATLGAIALLALGRPGKAQGGDTKQKPTTRKARRKRRRRQRARITTSTLDRFKTVRETPRQLLAQARKRVDADVTLEELTAARLIASEHSRGSIAEMAAIVDAEANRARRKKRSLTDHLTSAGTYGKQGGRHGKGKRRPASTRRDPTREHLRIARAVLHGEMRGIARGAVRFYDPVSQWSSHRKWITGKSDRRHCHPAVILERWTHDKKWNKRGPDCALRAKPGRHLQEWVGPIDDINPLRLMLLRPAEPGEEHQRRYREALRLILERYPLPTENRGGKRT